VLSRFAPPLALMGLIFLLSAQADLSSGLGLIDLVGRKIIHATQFGLLWWLWLRALNFRMPWLAAAIAIGYAVSDEYHQTFVPGRHGTPIDVLIDAAGVPIAWAVDRRLRGRRDRRSEPAALGGDQDGLGAVDRPELAVDVVEVGADRARREREL
jgi:hypothetical protein